MTEVLRVLLKFKKGILIIVVINKTNHIKVGLEMAASA